MRQHAQSVVDSDASAVVLAGRWSLYGGGGYDGPDLRFALHIPGEKPPQSANDALENLRVALERTVSFYRQAGLEVVVIQQLPEQKVNPRFVLERILLLGLSEAEAFDAMNGTSLSVLEHEEMQGPVRNMILDLKETGVHIVTLDRPFLQHGVLRWFDKNMVLYKDSDHILANGAALVAPALSQALERSLRIH